MFATWGFKQSDVRSGGALKQLTLNGPLMCMFSRSAEAFSAALSASSGKKDGFFKSPPFRIGTLTSVFARFQKKKKKEPVAFERTAQGSRCSNEEQHAGINDI